MDGLVWKIAAIPRASSVRPDTPQQQQQQQSKGAETVRLDGTGTKGGRGRFLSPLPLPQRSLVPAPLRFLWYTSKGDGEDAQDGSNGQPVQQTGSDADADKEFESSSSDPEVEDENGAQDASRIDPPISNTSPIGFPERSEVDNIEQSSSKKGASGSWIQNFLSVNNFLKRKAKLDASPGAHNYLNDASVEQDKTQKRSEQDSGQIKLESGGSTASHKDCRGCDMESRSSCSMDPDFVGTLEVPYHSTIHNQESFAKFLQEVPLSEMKTISQTSLLCNLAYMIPEIKPGELARYHRLFFVTSSVDIKAEALGKERDLKALKERTAAPSVARDTTKGDPERSAEGNELKLELSPAAAYQLAAAAASFLRLQRKATSNSNSQDDGEIGGMRKSQEALEAMESSTNETADEPMLPSAGISDSDLSTFMGPMTSVVAAEQETKQEVADKLRTLETCPCQWFTCDERGSHTRFFVIQGSESLASWQANLLFEPVEFEEELGLGVMVHRGIYEAAKGLYEQVLPLVLAHLKAHGDRSRFRFTGHSLGGSLAMLLTFMLQIRGVVKASDFLPVYTFGSPYIMCGGDYLLKKLGLPERHVQYVVMHRDIVPRIFACNYPDHVAEVLRRVNGTFRDHTCLIHQKLLYAPMGQMMVIQPSEQPTAPHPLLPAGSGLYIIRHQLHHDEFSNLGGIPSRAVQLRAAQRSFLNSPHPLEILSDPGAYGSEGLISKFHNPSSYMRAVNYLLRQEMRKWRRIQRDRRRQLWWPLVNAETYAAVQRGSNSEVSTQQIRPPGLTHFVNDMATGRATFPVSISENSFKSRFSKYRRLIASEHVQMGMLAILSARMLITSSFAVFFTWV